MANQKILFATFILLCLVQLYIPASMIFSKEKVLTEGKVFKFKTAPVDPTDPFRGKYITLWYEQNSMTADKQQDWRTGETVYATIKTDQDGFAVFDQAFRATPQQGADFLKAKVRSTSSRGNKYRINLELPFDRYYMEESIAYEAELAFRESRRDSTVTTYGLVSIQNGEAVLKDVMIGEIPISEVARQRQANKHTD